MAKIIDNAQTFNEWDKYNHFYYTRYIIDDIAIFQTSELYHLLLFYLLIQYRYDKYNYNISSRFLEIDP